MKTPRPAAPATSPPSPGKKAVFHLLPAAFLLLSFVTFILRNWHIKAYSDPMAWLNTAKAFPAILATSDLPLGYPAFLWLALKLTGPYYVFLANLPVLALLLTLIGMLAAHAARETEPADAGISVGILTAALLLGFDPDLLVYMTNPYRDPLSYVLLTGALALLARYVALPYGRRWYLAVSGLLTGLAYCVREPSLLAVGPMFLLGVLHERKAGLAPLLRSTGAFALGLAAGALPLLLQTFVIRQQVAISPYSGSRETLLPGFHAGILSETLSKAGVYFFWRMGWIALALLLTGMVFALCRRNRTLLSLALLSALYALFYGFYWIFSSRYYYVVALCGAPLVAFGTYAATSSLLRLARRSAWTGPVFRWIVLLVSLAIGAKLLAAGSADRPFRAEQARRFTETMLSTAPLNATIYCDRPLADVIRTLAGRSTAQLDLSNQEAVLRAYQSVRARLLANQPVFFFKTAGPAQQDPYDSLFRRHFDLLTAAEFPSADYRLENFTWGNPVSLYRIQPWSRTQTEHALAIECPSILRLDVGQLWDDDTRTRAELRLNGQPVTSQLQNGVHYVAVLPVTPQPTTVVLNSDRPVPADLRPALLPPDDPIELDFGLLAAHSHDARLSPEFFRDPAHNLFARRLNGRGTLTLPLPWREPMTVFAEVFVRPADMGTGGSLSIATPNGASVTANLPANARYRGILVPIDHDGLQDSLPVDLSGSFDLDRICLHPARALTAREVDVGSPADAPFLSDGFFGPETLPDGATARWSAPNARIALFLAQPASDAELQIEYADTRPPAAPPANASLTFNGRPLALRDEPHPVTPGRRILRAPLPAALVQTGDNRLEVACQGWKPSVVSGSPDSRELGLHVVSIRVCPPALP